MVVGRSMGCGLWAMGKVGWCHSLCTAESCWMGSWLEHGPEHDVMALLESAGVQCMSGARCSLPTVQMVQLQLWRPRGVSNKLEDLDERVMTNTLLLGSGKLPPLHPITGDCHDEHELI